MSSDMSKLLRFTYPPLIGLISIIQFSCNSGNSQKQVESSLRNAELLVKQDYDKAKDSFDQSYQNLIERSKADSSFTLELHGVKTAVDHTLQYIDSLTASIDQMETQDPNRSSSELLYNGTADSLFHKLDLFYDAMEIHSHSTSSKELIRSSRTNVLGKNAKKLYFQDKTPWQLNVILNSMKIELFTIGNAVVRQMPGK